MRKFFGSAGSVTRVTVESEARARPRPGGRRCARGDAVV